MTSLRFQSVWTGMLLIFLFTSCSDYHREQDWRDYRFYMLMTDRFDDGDVSNNDLNGIVDNEKALSVQGGDFRGIEKRLPYLRKLGINVIWLTPVQKNVAGAFHGYWIQDFMRVDPRLGTMEELQSLVKAAHRQGIRVFLDVICNHFGPLAVSDDGRTEWNEEGYNLVWKDSTMLPSPAFFADLNLYHNFGLAGVWEDPYQILGELPGGLNDLKTERADVRAMLIEIWKWWIEQTDCDGFRVDTVKHVESGFWYEFLAAIKDFARSRGKNDFFIFGEIYNNDDEKCSSYTHPDSLGRQGFDGVLNFSVSESIRDVFATGGNVSRLAASIENLSMYHEHTRPHLITFVDNHDMPRFLHIVDGDTEKLKRALAFLYFAEGIPILYYGTEQGFLGGDPDWDNRECMFEGGFKGTNPPGDAFDEESELYKYIRKLMSMRHRNLILRRGHSEVLFADDDRRVLVVARKMGKSSAVAICNLSDTTRTVSLPVEHDLRLWDSEHVYEAADGVISDIEAPSASVTILLPIDLKR